MTRHEVFALGERVEIIYDDGLLHPAPGTVGRVVGCEGVLDCCHDPSECYAVRVVDLDGREYMMCVPGQNLRLVGRLN